MSDGKCEICKEGFSKYKCPVCLIKFCCVACYKSHKESEQCIRHQETANKSSSDASGEKSDLNYEFETEDTVKPERLRLLRYDQNVIRSLQNPHLRDMIKYLDSTKNPVDGMEQAMKEPIFVEFVEHCLRVVDDEDN